MTKTQGIRKGRKRVSKKNKIAWRKHCSTKDVDAFLDDVRLEERVGIKFSSAEDDKLFYVDKTVAVPKTRKEKVKSKAQRKLEAKKKLDSLPKCFQALLPHSSVPDPVIKRNKIRTKEERKHPIRKKIEAARKACGKLTQKEEIAAKNREFHEIKKVNEANQELFAKDLWGGESEAPIENPEVDIQWLNPTTFRHVLKNTGKIQKKIPASVRGKTSILPAVETPHPGSSYNPSYTDHRALLESIVDHENKLIKEEDHLNRVTTEMFRKLTPEENQNAWVKEMLQGHPKSDEVTIKEEEDHEKSEYKAVNPPAKDKKKTRKQRRNLRIAKEEAHERNIKAIEKKKVADIYKLKKIAQNINKEELNSLKNQALQQKKKELKKLEAKRLSALKYQEPEQDFNMPYDLSGNLRGLMSEGNMLRDRLKSLQKRNVIQPMKKRIVTRAKKKAFTKQSHK